MPSDLSLVEQASGLLKEINLLYGLASGVLLKYSFENTKDVSEFKRNQVLLAGLAGLGSLVLSLVLVALMWNVALDALDGGAVRGTLVIFVTTFVVMLGLAIISVWAVGRAAGLVYTFRGHLSD